MSSLNSTSNHKALVVIITTILLLIASASFIAYVALRSPSAHKLPILGIASATLRPFSNPGATTIFVDGRDEPLQSARWVNEMGSRTQKLHPTPILIFVLSSPIDGGNGQLCRNRCRTVLDDGQPWPFVKGNSVVLVDQYGQIRKHYLRSQFGQLIQDIQWVNQAQSPS